MGIVLYFSAWGWFGALGGCVEDQARRNPATATITTTQKKNACAVVKRYLSKISGPLLDHIDLQVEVTPVSYDELTNAEQSKLNSAEIRDRMLQARAAQWAG